MNPLSAGEHATAFRLMTRLFLRRLLDNDLISPHADRHESLAVVYGLVVSLAVFATFFMSTNYLAAFIQFPGPAALSALSDRFLFIAASISISALAALMVWEALGVETRDAAILGPLPIAPRTIGRAKLAAAMVFGAVLTVALNAIPSVIYPAFLTMNIRGTRGTTILRLIAAHATTVMMAGLFGYFAVLAVRGALRLLLGEEMFRRVSSGVQSALIVGMITALLLAPTVRATQIRDWVNGTVATPWPARPALWYLGFNEAVAGHLVAETPVVLPPRLPAWTIRTDGNARARAIYRGLRPHFSTLARGAWLSMPLAMIVALATFLWTNRRLPDRSAGVPGASRLRASIQRIGARLTQDDPEAQAGFFFAFQTLTRSAPHRTLVAIAVALGLTHALIVLAQIRAGSFDRQSVPAGVFSISIMLLLTLLAGIAYAATVPAAPAANWTIRMAWLGDERRYLAGVKRAATIVAAALLALLLPLHIALLGVGIAVAQSLFGLLFAMAALDALFLFYRKLPFVCNYVPVENPKIFWPAAFAGLLIVTYGFANAERWALRAPTHAMSFAAILGAVLLLLRAFDRVRRRDPWPMTFDDRPSRTTQRLGLLEHVTIYD